MKIKIIALIVGLAVIMAGFLVGQTKKEPRPALPKPTITSEVSKIKAAQTSPETGDVEYTLEASSLTENIDGTSQLNEVVMHWTPLINGAKVQYTLSAQRASLDKDSGEFVFDNGFTLIKHTDDIQELNITGGTLLGNTKTKRLVSQNPILVNQAGNEFNAQGFDADLNEAIYNFHQIQMSFRPPKTQETPLF